MSAGELLLTLLIGLLVFGPSKLPMLAHHLGQLIKQLNHYKQKIATFWQAQLNEQQLQENIKKASKADRKYQQDKSSPDSDRTE